VSAASTALCAMGIAQTHDLAVCCLEASIPLQEPINVLEHKELLEGVAEGVVKVKWIEEAGPRGVLPLLPDGSKIEYFSRRNKIWVPGRLEVSVENLSPIVGPQVSYNVHTFPGTARGRTRKDVPLNSFRRPFQEGEELEVFSRSRGSRWVPCTMRCPEESSEEEPKKSDGWGYRYQVSLDTVDGSWGWEEEVLERVPPSRLRRRFAPGTQVWLYRGPEQGYCSAVVDPAAAAAINPDDLSELEVAFSMGPAVGGTLLSTMSGASVGSIFSEFSMPAITGPTKSIAVLKPVMLGAPDPTDSSEEEEEEWDEDDSGSPWCMVPAREWESSKYVLAPSYLVQVVTNEWLTKNV